MVLGKGRGDLGLVADESGVEALRLDVVLNELVEDSTSERRAGDLAVVRGGVHSRPSSFIFLKRTS